MGAGGVVATVGAVTVMLMAMASSAGAQAGNVTDDVQERAVAEIQNASMAAEEFVQDTDALKNDTTQTAVDTVLDAYGTTVEDWPESIPKPPPPIRGFFGGVLAGRDISMPAPPNLAGQFEPRPQPAENPPAPPPEEEVRKKFEGVTGGQTHNTSTPDPPHESNTTRDNETFTEESPKPLERGSIPYVDTGRGPEPTTRPPANEIPPAPLGMVASEANRVPVPDMVVVAAAGLALAAAVAWLLSQTRLLRLAGGSVVALFSRQTGPEVLRSPVRARIHAAVTNESGITFAKLRQLLGMPPSTLRYHIAILRRENLIRVTRRGRTLHYHDVGARVDGEAQAREYLFWRNRGLLASTILQHPGANRKAVARMTGLLPSRVSEYTKELADAGLVRSERVGRCRHYFPTPMLQAMMASGQVPTSRG